MAKKKKHHAKRRTAVTNPVKRRKTRKVTHKTISRRKARKRNPSEKPIDLAITLGSAAAAAVIAPKLVSKLKLSPMVQNLGIAAAGLALAFFGRKHAAAVGAGAGLFVAGASRQLVNTVPMLAGENELTHDEQAAYISAATSDMNGEELEELEGPFAGPMSGPMSGPVLNGIGSTLI